MILVIAEKKDVALAISAALPGKPVQKGGSITQGDYVLTWLYGHVLTLKEPEDYDKDRYEKWSVEQLPINFNNWDTKPKPDAKDRFDNVSNLLKRCDTVIHAGDPDQEGQLLVDEVLKKCRYTGKVLRLSTNDVTKAGLQHALQHMDDNRNHIKNGESAYARSVADFIVGINMSRLFSCINPGFVLTVGRVQTPTLGLVVSRDAQIEGHKKQLYYTISATANINGSSIGVKYEPKKDAEFLVEGKILNKNTADDIARQLKDFSFTNAAVTHSTVKEKPPLPFNLVKLQTYCSRRYNLNPGEVMDITESLRMKHQAITYNRSDCQYLTMNQYAEAPDTVATVIRNIRYSPKGLDTTLESECFNDKYVVNHSAIIPTNTQVDIKALTSDEKSVYLAICQFFLAQFMPPATKDVTKVVIPTKDGGKLTASSVKILDPGYLTLFKKISATETEGEDEESETPLSQIPDGSYGGTINDATVSEKETKPPKRYTQATLNADMTCISKYVTDKRIQQILRDKDKDSKQDNGSIGTVATRASIISGLIAKGYLEEKGKNLVSTPLGREFYRILPDEIKGVNTTAEWWLVCEDIVAGKAKPEDLQNSVVETMARIIGNRSSYPNIDITVAGEYMRKKVIGKCPRCGSSVVIGKQGYGCSGWRNGCKFVIWKKQKGTVFQNVTISEKQATALLEGKAVMMKRLVSPSTGNEFSANVTIKDPGNDVEYSGTNLHFTFDDASSNPIGKCPRCGGAVTEHKESFGCSNWKSGCKFTILKKAKLGQLKGVSFSREDAKELLAGKAVLKKGLVDKEGKKYSANIILDDGSPSEYGAQLKISRS